jgi:hypothetical protein
MHGESLVDLDEDCISMLGPILVETLSVAGTGPIPICERLHPTAAQPPMGNSCRTAYVHEYITGQASSSFGSRRSSRLSEHHRVLTLRSLHLEAADNQYSRARRQYRS